MTESIPTMGEPDGGERSRRCATPKAGLVLAVAIGVLAVIGLIAAAVALRCWLF